MPKIKIRPLDDRVVVEPVEAEERTAGGIVLPDTAKEKPQRGKVLAVGPGKLLDSGKRGELSDPRRLGAPHPGRSEAKHRAPGRADAGDRQRVAVGEGGARRAALGGDQADEGGRGALDPRDRQAHRP